MWSSVLSSRGVRPFYILTAPDDYILSLSLGPSLCPGFHPRRESRIPSERSRNDTLLLPSSPFYFLGFFGCSRRRSFRLFSRLSLSSPRWGRKNSTGLTENNIPGKRAERVIIPTKHPPRLGQSLLGVGRSWNSAAVLSPVCWRRLEFAEFLEFPLHSLRACALPSLALC